MSKMGANPPIRRQACEMLVFIAGNKVGGASRDRTDDLKLAKLALSQLSYGPVLVELDKLYTRKGCCTGGPSRS